MYQPKHLLHRISLAPMLDVTNVHFRFLMRLLTKQTTLWTEMIHSNTIVYNSHLNTQLLDEQTIKQKGSAKIEGYKQMLHFNTLEHPVVIQLGGSDPSSLAKAAKLC